MLKIDFLCRWQNYLLSGAESVAISIADAKVILSESFYDDIKFSVEDQGVMVENYLDFIQEISDAPLAPKLIDMMATISSCLLLCKLNDEQKIEELFKLIVLSDSQDVGISRESFLVAMVSFERGVANVMGKKHESLKADMEGTVAQWMTVANNGDDKCNHLTFEAFSDFCTNRQQPVRKLLHVSNPNPHPYPYPHPSSRPHITLP